MRTVAVARNKREACADNGCDQQNGYADFCYFFHGFISPKNFIFNLPTYNSNIELFLQLFIMYFVVLASSNNGIAIGALTFGLNSGAYVAEIVRAGFESVDYGQMEAGRSLGMSTGQTMIRVVTPQAVRNVLPPLFNEFITLVKETAIVGYVGILDLGKVPGIIQSRTFDYLFPLLIAACMYLVTVMGLTGVLKLVEKQMAKTDRNYKKISVRGKKKEYIVEA